MFKKYLLFLLIFNSFVLDVIAQRYSFIEYSTAEGLPQSQVNAIEQDNNGYLWVGTFGGLSKFNGTEFVNFGEKSGLLTNVVTCLKYLDGKLYVGHDNGLSIQNLNNSFDSMSFPNNNGIANTTGIIKFNNSIYIATNGEGLFRLKNDSIESVEDSPNRIRGMTVVSNELMLATRNGIFAFSNNKFSKIDLFPTTTYSDITTFNSKIYTSTYNGEVFCLNDNKLDTIYTDLNFPIRNIYITPEEEIWINARNGAIKIGETNIYINESTGLPINDVNLIFKDREKNIWLGTGGRGLLKFSGETFVHYNKANGLKSELIISTLEDKDGNYWLSSFDKGLFYVKKSENDLNVESVPYVSSTVWSSARIGDKLFFGSLYGLYIYDGKNWQVKYEEDGLPANKITGLKEGGDSNIYIGTSKGVAIYNKGEISKIEKAENLINARDFEVRRDTLFIGARSGLYYLTNNQLKVYKNFDSGVNSLSLDANNCLWVGTESGVFKQTDKKFELLKLDDSGTSDYVNFIKSYKERVFLGTNKGLYEVNVKKDEKYYYGINSGLIDLETNLNSAFIDSKNNLWFGTVAGLMKMNLDKNENLNSESLPLINLDNISVNFKQIDFDTKVEGFTLSHKENNIMFSFDGIYLSNPKQLRFRYVLEGLSEEWSPLSKSGVFNFTNLAPGDYKLKVQSVINENRFSEPYEFKFYIRPPFYQTYWFYTIVFILIVILFILLDKIRTQRIKRKNYQLNLEVKSKLIELEQQSLNASMNRHFIFNALNSIQYYINSADTKSANRYLTRFAKLIRKNLDSSHSSNGMVTLSDELERLKLYLDIESMRFKDKFEYRFFVEKNVETDLLKVPAMFLQPFVENSIIHGILPLKDRVGKIEVNVTDHLDHIRIEVKDNGVGIDASLEEKIDSEGDHYSRGVKITKGRIELLQKISARSIELIGPHQINEDDSSVNGTVVIFKILKQYLEDE